MAITGQLAEFSLPELFQFLEQGNKTGQLTLQTAAQGDEKQGNSHPARTFYIWLRKGRIVSASSYSDGNGLLRLLYRKGLLQNITKEQIQQFGSLVVPLGVYLKIREQVTPEQLKLTFYTQVMRQVCALFEYSQGQFEFESGVKMPMQEMTGHMMLPTEVTLGALRVLKNWDALEEKLPETNSTLESAIEGKPHLKLNELEWQMWEFTNGTVSLASMAEQLRMDIEEARRVAFRLILVGIAEEVPMVAAASRSLMSETPADNDADDLSESFLESLVDFLKGNAQ